MTVPPPSRHLYHQTFGEEKGQVEQVKVGETEVQETEFRMHSVKGELTLKMFLFQRV